MTNHAIILLVLLPMFSGVVCALVRKHARLQRVITIGSLAALAAMALWMLAALPAGGAFVSDLGGWPPPFGIAVVFDGVSGVLIAGATIVSLACGVFGVARLPRRVERVWLHPLLHLQVMGVTYSLMTGDLFNLFVAFEIMLMASYALLCLGGGAGQIAQAYKYVVLNLVASAVFVLSAGLVYGMTGTLNFADLARFAASAEAPAGFGAVSVLLLFVFAAKGALFPLWFWLPDAYPTMPPSLAALFAALLTKVGLYAILRLFPMVFAAPGTFAEGASPAAAIIGAAASATMVVAIVAALGTHHVKRALCLILIAHVGYLAFGVHLGLAAGRVDGLTATLFYMTQEMLLLAGLFLAFGLVERHAGGDDLHEFGGLLTRAPWLAAAVMLLVLGLAGVPPLPGFIGKVLFLREGIEAGAWIGVGALVFSSVLTLVVGVRLWARAFWGPLRIVEDGVPAGGSPGARPGVATGMGVVWSLIGLLGVFTIASESLLGTMSAGCRTLLSPRSYVEAVLGPGAWPEAPATPLVEAGGGAAP